MSGVARPRAVRSTTLRAGDGLTFASRGNQVDCFYRGTLSSGAVFHAVQRPEEPFSFTMGDNNLVAGWAPSFDNQSEGGIFRAEIPAHLGYGAAGYPADSGEGYAIPPDADLVYEIEIVKVHKPVKAKPALTAEERQAIEDSWDLPAPSSSTAAKAGKSGKGKKKR
jgi:FKBP-type peptidyl-prolyl cis-trans isomerase